MSSFLAVFIGGGLGSLLRYSISLLYPYTKGGFPWGTFITNMLACLLLGAILGYLSTKGKNTLISPLLAIGFCGGFSTFSTFSLEGMKMIQNNEIALAISYSLISILLGVGLVFAGLQLSQKLIH